MDARPRDRRLGSRSLTLMALAMATAAASCAGGTGGTTGTGGSTGTGTGGTTSTGGTTGTGGSNTGTGGTTSGTGGTNVATGGVTGTGGATGSGGVTGTGGASSTGGTTGTGGSNAGTGGTAGSKGTGGSGGSSTGGANGTGGTTGTAGTGGCPSNATFCSGFESPGLPTGATYLFNGSPGDWSRDFAIDTSQHHAGSSSLLVKNATASGSSGSMLRLLGVPVPTGAFWVRFWVQSDMPMGGTDHNGFAGPSNFDTGNTSGIIDSFCEDRGIAFNTMDSDVTWPTGYGQLQSGAINLYTLPAMTWKCVELSYDLTNRHQQLYIGGSLVIDAANYPPSSSYPSSTFAAFTFGFQQFHGPPRQMWYDDVAVAPTRIGGCN